MACEGGGCDFEFSNGSSMTASCLCPTGKELTFALFKDKNRMVHVTLLTALIGTGKFKSLREREREREERRVLGSVSVVKNRQVE